MTVKDLVNKDVDGDGIPDWEETLYNLDPNSKETTLGVPDNSIIAKLRNDPAGVGANSDANDQTPENLTETDKFSRELFSTVASLNQNGTVSEDTVNKIGSSLAEKIQNRPPQKIYSLNDLKMIDEDTPVTIKNYADSLNNIFKDYPTNTSVIAILQKFIVDKNNVDVTALQELDPIIAQMQDAIDKMSTMSVPKSISLPHLDFLNAMERVVENLKNIKLYDADAILAYSGIQQYQANSTLLESSLKNLSNELVQKLNN